MISINGKTNVLQSIEMNKIHLIRQVSKIHFTINSFYQDDRTDIRITDDNYHTAEFSLPLVNFNLKNKKHIDKTLQKISLLV
jgi:hypothetical protein